MGQRKTCNIQHPVWGHVYPIHIRPEKALKKKKSLQYRVKHAFLVATVFQIGSVLVVDRGMAPLRGPAT